MPIDWQDIAQMEFSQLAPICLLFGILFLFSLVCIIDWYRSGNQVASYYYYKDIAYLPLSDEQTVSQILLHIGTADDEMTSSSNMSGMLSDIGTTNSEDDLIYPSTITVTNGKTGEEKNIPAHM